MECLLRNLKGSINNNLMGLGEVSIRVFITDASTNYLRIGGSNMRTVFSPAMKTSSGTVLEDFTVNSPNLTVKANSPGEYTILVKDKYKLSLLDLTNLQGSCFGLEYLPSLTEITGNEIAVDTESLKDSILLTNLSLPKLSGDIGKLQNCSGLTEIVASEGKTYGKLSDISALTLITVLNLGISSKVNGNLSALSNLSSLTSLTLGGYVTVDNSILPDGCNFTCSNTIGDFSKIQGCRKITDSYGSIQWSDANGRSGYTCSVIGKVASSADVDRMLNNLVSENVSLNPNDSDKLIDITVTGGRTSASDAAVAKLKGVGYGYTIKVNGVTQ